MCHRIGSLLALCSLFIGACMSGGRPDGDRSDDSAGVPRLAEAYAFRVQLDQEVQYDGDRLLADVRKTETTAVIGYVTVEVSGDDLTLSARPCKLELPPLSDGMGGTYTAQLRPLTADVAWAFRGELAGSGDGFALDTEAVALALGAELDDPIADPVPQDRGEPEVRDHDDDGNPGVTLAIVDDEGELAAEVFAVMRGTFELDGAVQSVEDGVAVHIVGSDAKARFLWPNDWFVLGGELANDFLDLFVDVPSRVEEIMNDGSRRRLGS
jgi:hypothetical protein